MLLTRLVFHRKLFIPIFLGLCLCAGILIPFLGQDFFPATDSGEFILHVRAATGTRIEETASSRTRWKDSIRQTIPAKEVGNILDNLGLPYSPMNTMHLTNGLIGPSGGDIMVTLNEDHHPTADYVRELRAEAAAAVSRAQRSTSCPRISPRRSSTSVCPRPSTCRFRATTWRPKLRAGGATAGQAEEPYPA